MAVPSYAASETTYSILDFDVEMTSDQDYSNSVTYGSRSNFGFDFVTVSNSNTIYFTPQHAKFITAVKLNNFRINDEYNITFTTSIFSQRSYSIVVCLIDDTFSSTDQPLAVVYDSGIVSASTNYDTCNVNFTLSNLGISSNSNIYLYIVVAVPLGYTTAWEFGFTDIVLTDLDDDTGLLDSILNWLSRIYHSIAGGTDREGVNHTGIVQGIVNALTNVKNAIVNAIDGIEQWFIDLKDNIVDGLKSLFIPRDGYFAEKKTQLETFATEHFGALYQGPDIMIDLIRKLLTVDPSANPGITMPAIEFDFQGQHYTLTQPIHYSFSWVNDSSHPLYYFYHIYRGFVTVILFVGFGNYLIKKYRDVFEGGGDGE